MFLGGNGTLTSSNANGGCSRLERLMGLKPKDADIYSTYNDVDIIGFYYGRDKEENTHGSVTRSEIAQYVNQLLIPLCVDEQTKRALPIETICKNFSKLIFFTHCYGAVVLNDMLESLRKTLLIKGLSKDDIDTIYSNSINITYSPLEMDFYLPTVSINSFADSFNEATDLDKWFENRYKYKLNGVDIKFGDKGFFGAGNNLNSKIISVYSSKLFNLKPDEKIDEHTSDCVDLNEKWLASKKSGGSKNSECVSRMVGYVLASAGARALKIQSSGALKKQEFKTLYKNLIDIKDSYLKEDLEVN